MDELKSKPESRKKQKRVPPVRTVLMWICLIVLALFIVKFRAEKFGNIRRFTVSDFERAVEEGMVQTCRVFEDDIKIRGQLVDGTEYRAERFPGDIALNEFKKKLDAQGIEIEAKSSTSFLANVFISLLPVLFFVGLFWIIISHQMKGAGRGAMSFGKSRARLLSKDRERATFKDVAGVQEAKEELDDIIKFLKDPKRFQKLGGRIPKGVILMGPPGTGKTLLAKSIAGEADVPFFTISGSDFVEMFVGVGASRVRDLFEQGKRHAPCIIFMDEIDAVGRYRGAGIGGGHDEREQTLNALLVEMDGFNTQEGVILIAATNRPDVLDPALLRPGRFDRQVILDLPDLNGREGILHVHAKKVTLDPAVDLKHIARGTAGFSGADLANLVNEAALHAAKENKEYVGMTELEESRDKVMWGKERKSRVLDEKDKKITAYHEAGHAITLHLVEETEPLHKVTIIPRGMAYLGATMQLPEKDKYMEGKQALLGTITGLMGGRVAEEITFGEITSGASSDIKRATMIARRMVCEWGMSNKLGPMTFGEREEHIFLGREISRSIDYSETTAIEIDKEIYRIIDECYKNAHRILEENKDTLRALADVLLEKEVVDGNEVARIIEGKSPEPKPVDSQQAKQ